MIKVIEPKLQTIGLMSRRAAADAELWRPDDKACRAVEITAGAGNSGVVTVGLLDTGCNYLSGGEKININVSNTNELDFVFDNSNDIINIQVEGVRSGKAKESEEESS